jgi:mRNA interferase MazF
MSKPGPEGTPSGSGFGQESPKRLSTREDEDRHGESETTFPRRGEICLVECDPTRDHEIRKTRASIIQNDAGNRHSPITLVAAITSRLSAAPYPVDVVVDRGKGNGLAVRSAIHLDQIRPVDRERLVKRLGVIDAPRCCG